MMQIADRLICVECAAGLADTAMPPRVKVVNSEGEFVGFDTVTDINRLINEALRESYIEFPNGARIGILAESMWKGSLICRYHAAYHVLQERRWR